MKTIRLNTSLIATLGDVIYMRQADMIAATTIATATWYYIMQHVGSITVQQLLLIANGLKIPVRRFFSFGKADIIGKRGDYITDPYRPCYYDAEALRRIVETRADATWQKASRATGVTYDNLKKSALTERRLPVSRFLTVCEAFAVDPFTILIDPNPEARKERRRASDRDGEIEALRIDNEGLHAAIERMNDDLRMLGETVAGLKEKYEELLKAHDDLAKRVNISSVNVNNIEGNFIGIAAEP